MKLPDGSTLMHGSRPYDPVKAHEYYMRTRKLKGRKKGSQSTSSGGRKKGSPSYTIRTGSSSSVTLTAQQYKEQQAYAAHRVSELKKKMSKLNAELKKRMAEARRQEAKNKRGPTAAEKAEAAREAKKYRDKNQQKLANQRKRTEAKNPDKKATKDSPVESLTKQIDQVKKSLDAAIDRQRNLSKAIKSG